MRFGPIIVGDKIPSQLGIATAMKDKDKDKDKSKDNHGSEQSKSLLMVAAAAALIAAPTTSVASISKDIENGGMKVDSGFAAHLSFVRNLIRDGMLNEAEAAESLKIMLAAGGLGSGGSNGEVWSQISGPGDFSAFSDFGNTFSDAH